MSGFRFFGILGGIVTEREFLLNVAMISLSSDIAEFPPSEIDTVQCLLEKMAHTNEGHR